jgi:hypothetical protein
MLLDPSGEGGLRGQFRQQVIDGDRFLLMTDALAEWTLRQAEENGWPTLAVDHLLAELAPQAAFAGWVEEHRRGHGLRNDDVTLMVIDL